MNILIKLTCLIGLVIAPILGEIYGGGAHAHAGNKSEMMMACKHDGPCSSKCMAMMSEKKEIKVKMTSDENSDNVTAVVEETVTENGEEKTTTSTLTGTEEEVKAKVDALN